MMITKYSESNQAYSFLLFMLIFGALFQDLALQQIFGTIARSPIVFIAPLAAIFFIVYEGEYNRFPFAQLLLKYWIVSVIAAVLVLVYTVIKYSYSIPVMYGQNAIVKLIKSSSYNLLFFIYAYALMSAASKCSLKTIYKIIGFCFILLVILCFLEYTKISSLHFLHTPNNFGIYEKDKRIQLTASEPSVAAPFFLTISLSFLILRIYLKKGLFLTVLSSIFTLLVFLAISSKGAFLVVFCFLWALRKNFSLKTLLLAIVFSVPIILFTMQVILPQLQTDLDEMNSISTRLTTMTASFYSLFIYPIGEGYGTYMFYFPKLIVPVYQWLVQLTGIPFVSTELDNMVNTGESLFSKSGAAGEIMYNGWIAVIMFAVVVRYLVKQAKLIKSKSIHIVWAVLMSYLFLSVLFTVALESSYFLIIPVMLILKIISQTQLEEGQELNKA